MEPPLPAAPEFLCHCRSGQKWRGFFAGGSPPPNRRNWFGVGNAVKLVFNEALEGRQLVDVLMGRSEAIRAAVTAPAMLRVALVPASARQVMSYLDAKGSDALMAAAKACADP